MCSIISLVNIHHLTSLHKGFMCMCDKSFRICSVNNFQMYNIGKPQRHRKFGSPDHHNESNITIKKAT